MINIWHDIDPSRVTPESFTAVIEIPAGSKKKYELDKQTGLLRLDRILYTSTHYPANYGFIPRTYAGDGDPLDVLVLCSETLDPMVEVDCYPIGVIRMIDDDEIDDKIIAKANEAGVSMQEYAGRYEAEFLKDCDGLNALPPTVRPRATEHIDEILSIVADIIEKGYGYVAKNGDVYFRAKKFKEYGKLSHLVLEDLESGNRALRSQMDGDLKEDPADFAVWKAAKPGEPYWDSPYGKGRPGWHIECSAMARRHLGKTIDIHAGGEDLIFPHHENEIAQSEAANGKPFAHYWMHNGYINIDNKKMSKSLGNFFTVREVAEQYGYEVIRYMMVQAHYRSPINYCKELLDACKASLERLYVCRDTLDRAIAAAKSGEISAEATETFAKRKEQFITAMDDDLNTADGMTAIFELVRDLNRMSADASTSKEQLEAGAKLFDELTGVMGLLYNRKQADAIPAEVTALVEQRQAARKAKDFAEADRLRDEIAALGYAVRETRQGTEITKIDA